VTRKGSLLPAIWTIGQSMHVESRVYKPPSQLTKVRRVSVEDGESDELLHQFWPEGDEESPPVGTFEDCPLTGLRAGLANSAFFFECRYHDTL
jgi:hypothetical protein